MARIRTIKPEFPHSESIGRVSRDARLLFLMLFTIVDDAGRARAASRMLASLLYPYDDDAKTHIVQWMFELEREGCVRLYHVEGNAYLEIEKWLEHQKIDKPSKSRLPAPPPHPREASANAREVSATDLVPSTLDLVPVSVEAKASTGGAAAKLELVHGGKEPPDAKPDWWPKRDRYGRVLGEITDKLLYDLGKAVLGKSAGGMITRLKACPRYRRDWRAIVELLLRTDEASDPKEFFGKALHGAETDDPLLAMHEVFPETEYRA